MIKKIKKEMNECKGIKYYKVTVYLIVNNEEEVEYHTYDNKPDRVDVARFINFLEHYYCHRDISIELVAFEVTCTERKIVDRAFL